MAWVHNLDPFAIQFTEHFGIRWYGLAYLTGFIVGYYTIVWMSKRGGTQFTFDELADFVTYSAIGVLGGGRLGYCLFYAPELFTDFDGSFPFWGVLKVNEGGMASHGGILGVMLVCWVFARRRGKSFWHCLDLTVYGGCAGFFFGRLANFVNGELYGRPAPETLSWAVKFPQEMFVWGEKEFSRLGGLGPVAEMLGTMKTRTGEVVELSASVWQGWLGTYGEYGSRARVYEGLEAIIAAVQSGNVALTEALAPLLTPRYPSQLIQAVLEGLIVFLILGWIWRKARKPGVIAGWFGALYCGARIIGEQYRLPDAQIGYQLFGLTRGQWISIGMLAVAIALIVIRSRADEPAIAGWGIGSEPRKKQR